MALKYSMVFLLYLTTVVIVTSKPSVKIDAESEKISELTATDVSNRAKRQSNYIYRPFGYQSYYIINRPTQQPVQPPTPKPTRPTRRTTTQRYSIWQLSRKRRGAADETDESMESEPKPFNDVRKKRQIFTNEIDYNNVRYNLPALFGRRLNYAAPARRQPYTMWDLTRK